MRKNLLLFTALLFSLLLFFSACSENDDPPNNDGENIENDNETEETSTDPSSNNDENIEATTEESTFINLLEESPDSIESSDFDVIDSDVVIDPGHYLYPQASHGVLVFEDNDYNVLMDYISGEGLHLELSDDSFDHAIKDHTVSTDSHSGGYLFGDQLFATNRFQGDYTLLEVQTDEGIVSPVMDTKPASLFAKKDDVLYALEDEEKLSAFDLNKEEKLWESEVTADVYGYPELYVTENAVIVTSFYGLHAYSLDDGEELFTEDDYIYNLLIDGTTFYALAEEDNISLKVVEYDDIDGRQEELFETPIIDHVYEEYMVTLDLVDDTFYISFESGIFAYEANTYDLLWTLSVGEDIEDQRETGDDFDYDFYTAVGKEYIYAAIDRSDTATDRESLIAVINSKTGEVVEYYSVGEGKISTPIIDEETGKVVIYYYEYDEDQSEAKIFITNFQ